MLVLKILKKLYNKIAGSEEQLGGRNWKMFSNKEYANDLVFEILTRDEPCMIARFGSNELGCLTNYIGIKSSDKNIINYVKGKSIQWWWNKNMLEAMQNNAGFYPATEKNAERFCELMLSDIKSLDLLGSWLNEETYFSNVLDGVQRIVLEDLEPFFAKSPWTRVLEGKKVLVVHPFAETIERQYAKRKVLFNNNLLPEFDLKTIKAVQSIGGENSEYISWFEALEGMKKQVEETDFDICILGCGAYGFPLAAHVKRIGKKAVHLGGVTQLLFGIKGSRWEQFIVWPYMNLFNEHWVRPGDNEKPKNAEQVEGACYW